MKARERDRVQTLRLLLTAVKNRRIELGEELNEREFLVLVRRAVKRGREAAEQYRAGQREDLAAKEEGEILQLESYLPPSIDEKTMREGAAEFIRAEGLSGPQALGQVMKAMVARFEGNADGKALSSVVRELLGG